MSREILFRGKRIKTGKWGYGDLIRAKGKTFVGGEEENIFWMEAEVYPGTVGQCTGLCDKNGKKIFEGDIVHCEAHLDQADMVVIFEVGQFRLVLCEKFKSYTTGFGYYDINCFNKTVIGNIHDNAELAKEGAEWIEKFYLGEKQKTEDGYMEI